MDYSYFPSLMVRTPLYPFQYYRTADYHQLLQNKEFQAALFLASSSFFKELEKKQFDFESLTAKQKLTVSKYLNRACFRSTPFGLFSAFSIIKWTERLSSITRLATRPTPFIQPDFSVLEKFWSHYLKDQTGKPVQFYPNPTLYFSSVDLRYVRMDFDDKGQANFSMVSVGKNMVLRKLLRWCAQGKHFEEISNFLTREAGTDEASAAAFVKQLISEQILFSNNRPNITGLDYTRHFLQHFQIVPAAEKTTIGTALLNALGPHVSFDIDHLKSIAENLSRHRFGDEQKHIFYAVSERQMLEGGLPSVFQHKISEGLHCLRLLSSTYPSTDLVEFKKAFKARYEAEELPLLEVLDAQFGIGYGSFDTIKNKFSSYNSSQKYRATQPVYDQKRTLSFLLNEWQSRKGKEQLYEIEIGKEHLMRMEAEKKNDKLPPGISVMFRITGEDVVIENAGGNSALSLLGRFAFSGDAYTFAKEIARKEQELNPHVVFAEIAHIGDLHSANINRRPQLRDYEIPVLVHSTAKRQRQVLLSDIMVSVVDDTVILRSKKLGRMIIPRLSSAYNYTKSFFPVFRFLCDIQNQGLAIDFSLMLPSVLPDLGFYPRIRYRSCILQPAEWHFKAGQLDFFQQYPVEESLRLFERFASEHRLPRYFAYSSYDHFLVFDRDHADDIVFFSKEIRGKATVVLKEFPFMTDQLVHDASGCPLLAQYVAALYLDKEVYHKNEAYDHERIEGQSMKKAKDWLYFKIYCHPLTSDAILCDHLLPLVAKYSRSGHISKWFWVRYNDPDHHIRFRIRPVENMRSVLQGACNDTLVKLSNAGLVQRIQPDTYRQETGRYSRKLMAQVESVFHSSSQVIGNMIKRKEALQWNEDQILKEAAAAVYKMLAAFRYDPAEKMEFCRLRFYEFFSEFGEPKDLKLEMEVLHKSLHPQVRQRMKEKEKDSFFLLLQNNIRQLAEDHGNKNKGLEKLAADIIHMHLNRLFTFEQRYFEMLVYYMVHRSLAVELHGKK